MFLIQSLGTSLEKSLGFNGGGWCECRWTCDSFVVGTVGLLVATDVDGESFLVLVQGGSSLCCPTCQACGHGQELLFLLRRRHPNLLLRVEVTMKTSKIIWDAIIH